MAEKKSPKAKKTGAARTMSSGLKTPKPPKKQDNIGKGPTPRGGWRPGY